MDTIIYQNRVFFLINQKNFSVYFAWLILENGGTMEHAFTIQWRAKGLANMFAIWPYIAVPLYRFLFDIFYTIIIFFWGKGSFLIRSTLWNRRPLKWNSTIPPLDFLPLLVWVIKWSGRVKSGNIFTHILLNFLWFPESLGKINYLNFTKTKKYLFKMMSILFDYFFIS